MPLNSFNQNRTDDTTKYRFEDTTHWSFDNATEFANFSRLQLELHKSDPLYVAIPLTLLYSSVFVTGLLGNVITCVVILKNKDLHTATNYYLFSLAVSDLLLLVFGLPLEIYYIWQRYPYIFGEIFCIFRGMMAETSTNASVLTITAFTVERYIAICYPFFSHSLSNLSRAIKLIVVIWIISLLCAIPQASQFGVSYDYGLEFRSCTLVKVLIPYSFELSTLMFFIIPMVIITTLYVRIGVRLKSSAELKGRRTTRPMLSPKYQQSSSQRLLTTGKPGRKILKMLVAVVITFFVCWAPFHFQRIVAMLTKGPPDDPQCSLMRRIYDIVTYISAILFYFSTTVNPILYHTMSHKFRDAFKDTMKDICCRSGNINNSKFKGRTRFEVHHRSYKAKLLLDDSSGLEYSHNKLARIVSNETGTTDVTTNCNKVNLTQLDLNNSVLLCPQNVVKVTSFIDGANYKKEAEKKRFIVWCNNNNNILDINEKSERACEV